MSMDDLYTVGITPDNTSLKDKDYYKNIDGVKQFFTDENGKFDEAKFDSVYDTSALLYNDYANKLSMNEFQKTYTYDPFDWRYAEKSKENVTPTMSFEKNPMRTATNTKALGLITPSDWSIREIAQTEKVFNYETGKFEDWTPNDKGGLFKSLGRESLVLATWDEDGTHTDDQGRIVEHKKGEYKYHPITGRPYYETLGNREGYEKDFLHISDTLTREGTKINKFDFFDSDGLDKSVGGSVMKLTASIAPTLLGLVAPPIGLAYGGISALIALSQLMPTLGKAVNGFITNDNENAIGRALNKAEAYTSRFARSVSDKSREKTITFENAASLINDVAMQLFQQRAVQYIPRLFKNNPNIYNNAKLARSLSYAYMSGTSALESYSAFKRAGASDRVAGLGMFATMGAFYKIMSLDYFRDSYFKGSWFDDNNVKSPVWNVADDFMKAIQVESTATGKQATKELAKDVAENTVTANKRTLSELTKRFTDAIKKVGQPWKPMPFWERAFAEGTEEVMEETMQDAIKALFEGAEALGIPMNKQREKLDFGWSVEDAIKRYLMSFGGGFVGGAIFQGYNFLETRGHVPGVVDSDAHLSELVKLISDGRGDEIRTIIDRWHKEGRFGSKDLAATKLSIVKGPEGNITIASEADVDNISQNDFIYQALIKQVNTIDNILAEENFKTMQDTLEETLKKFNPNLESSDAAAKLARDLGLHSLVYKDLNRLATKIVQKRVQISDRIKEISPKTDKENTAENKEKIKKDSVVKDLQDQLKQLQKERDSIYNGDRMAYYVSQYALTLNSLPLQPFLGFSDFSSFVRARFGKNVSELSKTQIEIAKEEFKSYGDGDKPDTFSAIDIYNAYATEFAQAIENAEQQLANATSDSDLRPTTIGTQYIQHLKTREQYESRKAELEAKENLTEEESKELSDLPAKIDSVSKMIDEIRKNPKRTLYNETSNANSLNEKMQRRLNLNPQDIGPEMISEWGNEIKEAYRKWASSNTLKRSESELNAFFQLLGRTSLNKDQRWASINNWLSAYRDKVGEGLETMDEMIRNAIIGSFEPTQAQIDEYYSNGGNTQDSLFNWDGVTKFESHKKLESLLDKFYEDFGSDVETSLKNYQNIIDFLHEQGLTDEQIEEMLYTDRTGNGTIIPFIGNQKLPDFLQELAQLRKSIKRSVLPELLASLTTPIGDNQVATIFDMLDSEQKRLASQNTLDTYSINPQSEAGLRNAAYLLNALKGLIVGASNGTNSKINNYKASDKFAEITKESAALINEELDEYINRISFLLKLHEKNNGLKLSEHKEIAVNMRVKFLEKLTDSIHSEPFKDLFKKEGEEGIDPKELWEKEFKPSDFDTISADNYYKFEPIIIAYETELYNRVKALGFSNEEIADKIFDIFGENTDIWKQASTRLTKDKDLIIGDYDFAYYLLSVLTLNSNDYHVKLRQIVDEKFDKAPLYGHEYIVRMAYAMFLDSSGFNRLLKRIGNSYKGTDDYIRNRSNINNILFGFGGAGTGKSTSVAKLFKLMIENDADIVYLATGNRQLKILTNSVEAEDSATKVTYDEFFKNVAGDQLNPNNISKKDNGEIIVNNLVPNTNYKLVDANKNRHVFMCDEIEALNELQLRLLSLYAREDDIFVLALGDYKQPSGKLQIGNNTYTSGTEDLNVIKTPTLAASLRTLSVAKNDNYNKLDIKIDEIEQIRRNDLEKYLNPDELNKLVQDSLKDGITLDYFADTHSSRLVGDEIVNKNDDFISRLDRAISMATDKSKVLIVSDSKSASKYQADKYKNNPNVVQLSAKKALGGEYAYVFMDVEFEDDLFAELKKFYMLSQRANIYSAILDEENNYKGKLKIQTKNNPLSNALLQLNAENISDFKEWRLRGLLSVAPSENFDENIKPKEVSKLDKTPISEQAPPEARPTVDPKQSEDKIEEIPQNIEEPENPSKEQEEAPPTQQLDKPKTFENVYKKTNNQVFNEKDKIDSKVEDKNYKIDPLFTKDENNDYKPFITSVNTSVEIPNIKSDAFYKDVFSQDFYFDEKSNTNTLYNILIIRNKNKIDYNKYGKILSRIHKIVMSSDNIDSAVSLIKNSIVQQNNEFGLKFNDLLPYLQTSNKRIVLTKRGSETVINLQLFHENQKDFINIPIGYTNLKKTGVYTGWFTKVSDTYYERGKRITLAQLLNDFPGLDLINAAGILLGHKVSNYTGSESFAEFNDGKSFIAVGELMTNLSFENVFREAESKGKIWTYDHSDVLKLAGIQQTLSSDNVAKWIACWNYLRKRYLEETKGWIINDKEEKRLLSDLERFGLTPDIKTIENTLADLSGNINWSKYDTLANDDRGKLLFKKPGFISTPHTSGLLIASMLNTLLNNLDSFDNNQVWYNLRYELCQNIGSRRLWIKTENNEIYQLVATEEPEKDLDNKWLYSKNWQIQDESGNAIASVPYSGAVGKDFGKRLKELFDKTNINLATSSAMFLYKTEENGISTWNVNNTNQTIAAFLTPFIENGTYNKLFNQFKYGFYVNINSDSTVEYGPWKKLDISNKLGLLTTDASTWHYATYKLDESQIQSEETSDTTIDLINMWSEFKSDFLRKAGKNIDSELLSTIINDFDASFKVNDLKTYTELTDKIEECLSIVNEQILARTNKAFTKVARWDNNLGAIYWENENSKEVATRNVLAENGLDSDVNVLYEDLTGFGVYYNNDTFVVVHTEDGTIIGEQTNAGIELSEILKNIKTYAIDAASQRILYAYISTIASKQDVSLSEANKVWDVIKQSTELQKMFLNYLEKRLENGCL